MRKKVWRIRALVSVSGPSFASPLSLAFFSFRSYSSPPKVETTTTDVPPQPMCEVTIDKRKVEVPEHFTILQACNQAGIYVPTLCNHPRLPSVGTCRLCLVGTSVNDKLIPACTSKVSPGLEVTTQSPEINKYVKQNLELMLSRHPNACMTCEASGRCEFQDLVNRYDVKDKWPKMEFKHEWDVDEPENEVILRDLDKCVYCGRCVRACNLLQGMNIVDLIGRGTSMHQAAVADSALSTTDCIECGQCSLYCPVGAISPRTNYREVREILDTKHLEGLVTVASTAPAVRVAIGEELGFEPGHISRGQLVTSLRELGFDYVFDTQFSADLTIMEEGSELIERIKNGGPFPMFTSCCPAWVSLVEKCYPEFIPHLSSAKSPQQMIGALIKTYFAEKIKVPPEKIYHVSIMPCTAKKQEANRKSMETNGVRHVDQVLTTRELGSLIRMKKIIFASLPETHYDNLLGRSSGAGALFGNTGGVTEAALRTVSELFTGQTLPPLEFHDIRGLDGVKETSVTLGEHNLKICVVNGTGNTRHLLEDMKQGKVGPYHFVEVMACPGGCIGGGGQPKSKDPEVLWKRMSAIYKIDERKVIRKSHENPVVKTLYEEFLGKPLGHKSHELLHTTYTDRSHESKPASTPASLLPK